MIPIVIILFFGLYFVFVLSYVKNIYDKIEFSIIGLIAFFVVLYFCDLYIRGKL